MQALFVRSEKVTPLTRRFVFQTGRPYRFDAGQFMELTLLNPELTDNKRWFTISSSPNDELLAIITKDSLPFSAYKQALSQLLPGNKVDISAPMGDFVLPMDAARPLLFIAAGIGITPFLSMHKWLNDTGQRRNITLLYSAQTAAELIGVPDLDSPKTAAANVTYTVTGRDKAWHGKTGRIDASFVKLNSSVDADSLVYIAGPELFVVQLRDQLVKEGIAADMIVCDYFTGYTCA